MKIFIMIILIMMLAVPAMAAPIVPWLDGEATTILEWSGEGEAIMLEGTAAFDENWVVGDLMPLPIVPDYAYGKVRYAGHIFEGQETLSSVLGVGYILDDVFNLVAETRDIDWFVPDDGQFIGICASQSNILGASEFLTAQSYFYWGGGDGYDLTANVGYDDGNWLANAWASYRFGNKFDDYGKWEIELGKSFPAKNLELVGFYLDATRADPIVGVRMYYMP